ncbi:MAG TPA: class I SAM-dependent methyltransferase [Ramlibacter sp.]|nr:class I SAM-dependent methyltransferase [Ramlibacter sp.]
MNPSASQIETRRVGEYGHFVAPLSQLAADLGEFLGVDLEPFREETVSISRDEQGVHPEEAAVLYMLTRALRPRLVLETGTFKGYSTAEIARALRSNGAGRIVTVDLAPATGAMVPPDLLPWVTFHRGKPSEQFAATLARNEPIDLFFHDSLHTFMNTLGEIVWFADHLAPGSVIVCHDAKMDFVDDFGVGKAVRRAAAQLGLPFRVLDTTCGLAVLKWPAQPPVQALAELRSQYVQMQKRAAEGLPRRALRRLFKR